MQPQLHALRLGDEPRRWSELGFSVGDGSCQVGTTLLRFGGDEGSGLTSWSVAGVRAGVIDGLLTHEPDGTLGEGAAHANGVRSIDHIVAATPDFERSSAALAAAGLERRRAREAGRGARQGFFVVGEAHLELVGPVEPDGVGPASFWGITFVVDDMEAATAAFGDALGTPRDAVQPGRRIATVRRDAGLGTAVALMTPRT